MKWIALLLFVALAPALTAWLRENHRLAPRAWAVIGFMPFVFGSWHLIIAPVSWSEWPGYAKGMEVSLMDAVAAACFLSLLNVPVSKPVIICFVVYILAILLSAFFAGVPEASLFYAWQVARVMIVFAAVAKVCADERGPRAIIFGMILGLAVQAFFVIEQRMSGATQAGGTLGHQNFLGIVSHFVVFPSFALLLIERKYWIPFIGVMSGVSAVILGASRATLGLAGLGYGLLMLLSVIRKPTGRNFKVFALGLIGFMIATPLALISLQGRFEAAPLDDYDERAAFERAAKMAIADHPMGVGANQYVIVANAEGYSDRAGVVWNSGSRAANVHNTYLLVRAETGFLGLAAFIALLMAPTMIAFRVAWRNRKDPRGDLMLGLGVSLTIVSIHCFYEWVFMDYLVQVMFAINAGMIAGLAQQISREKSKRRKPGKSNENLGEIVNASGTA